jgi:hypothetical protein
MAVMAGWLAVAARRGYDAVLGICDDGTEWVGVASPQLRPGDLWQILPSPSEGGFVVLDRHVHPCFQSPGIRAVLHFVAPLPPGAPEPRLIPGEQVPSIMSGDGPDQDIRGQSFAPRKLTVH